MIVRFRAGWAVGNMFEYPVWLVTGLLIPVALLPGWVEPISWVLAPTWGMRALSDSAFATGEPLVDIAMCLVLSSVYTVLGAMLLGRFLESARRPTRPFPDVKALRVALVGGLLSFRGLLQLAPPRALHPYSRSCRRSSRCSSSPISVAPPSSRSDTFFVVGNSF